MWSEMKLRLLLPLLLYGGGLAAAPNLAEEQVFRRGNAAEPQTLDPHKAEGIPTSNILRDLYEGLVSESADGRLIPGAAQSWSISDDGLHYRFVLRADARWSNGDRVTAADFVRGLRRSADPATGSNYSTVLTPILNAAEVISGALSTESLGVQATAPDILDIQLQQPAPYLLGLLTHSATYPIHGPSLAQHGAGFARPGRLVSNGAFMLDEWQVQSHVSLKKSPHFHAADTVVLDRVIFYPTENPGAEFKRFRAGELDWTDVVPTTQLGWIRRNLADEFHVSSYLGTYYYGLNLQRPPFAGNPDLRRALALALDRKILTERIVGAGQQPAYSWVPPGVANYGAQVPDWASWSREQQLAEARRLYAAAGYGPERPLEVEIRYNTQSDHKKIAVTVAFMWKQALGVRTTLVNEEWKVFLQNRRFGKLTEVFRGAWISDYNDAFSFIELLTGGNNLNDTGYANPEYDRLVELAGQEADPQQRREWMQQAERVMLEDQPIIPIYFYVNARMVAEHVVGWQDNIMDHHPSRYVRILADN